MQPDYAKQLLNAIIEDLEDLTHSNGDDLLFTGVQKIWLDYPDSVPAATVLSTATSVTDDSINFSNRNYGFVISTYQYIENNSDQDAAEQRIDDLLDIQDRLLDYLQQIPNPIERVVSDVHVHNIAVTNILFNYQQSEGGLRLFLDVEFNLAVNINNKTI